MRPAKGCYFLENIVKCFFLNENCDILIEILHEVANKSTLVQVMAWQWMCDKPLPEAMLSKFQWSRWVNLYTFNF